ncbi:hypothetical protein MLD38_023002 [Melastoma candidum]|uniref:Uncharacterized protein n=1 Tax=Melastoma candidum TaxID=119954 RepID=A0ACB9QL51_9MYRT|nr:hypothetical protein MLD38_023002 [Melastoma candidum]
MKCISNPFVPPQDIRLAEHPQPQPLPRQLHQPLISHCSFVFTFTDSTESPSQQDSKRLKLNQLLYHIKYSRKPIDDELVTPIMSMLSANVFRPLPAPSNRLQFAFDLPDDEEIITTAYPNWPHLQVVYNILLRVIMTNDPEKLRPHVDGTS